MPEIKNQFTGGKMNKDLDERLVPNGQYRDAMNIEVSTSENSDVGTVQNILGNKMVPIAANIVEGKLPEGSIVVGTVADEKIDTLYWLVWTPETDFILSYHRNENAARLVFVDVNKDTLKFNPSKIITGINVIDGMLFWTDNENEPRKINIERCIQGTQSALVQTVFINNSIVRIGDDLVINGTFVDGTNNWTGYSNANLGTFSDTLVITPNPLNLISNGDFNNGTNGWTGYNNASLAITSTLLLSITPTASNTARATQPITTVVDQIYTLSVDFVNPSGSNVVVGFSNNPNGGSATYNTSTATGGTITVEYKATATTTYITLSRFGSDTNTILYDNVVVETGYTSRATQQITTIPGKTYILDVDFFNSDGSTVLAGFSNNANGGGATYNTSTASSGTITTHYIATSAVTYVSLSRLSRDNKTIRYDNATVKMLDTGSITPIEEKHITVIKKGPTRPLNVRYETSRDQNKIYTGVITLTKDPGTASANTSSFEGFQGNPTFRHDFNGITTEEGSNIFNVRITEGIGPLGNVININPINEIGGLDGWHKPNPIYGSGKLNNIKPGTKVVLKPFDDDGTPPGLPLTDYVIRGEVNDMWPTVIPGVVTDVDGAYTLGDTISVKVLSIDGYPSIVTGTNDETKWVIDLWQEEEKLFEFKFPRFSYRYKYEDGEYSTFAPWTQVVFQPGSFDYHPRKGYNLGMTNKILKAHLHGLVTINTPIDVVSIDVLFKDEPSPNIYVVDTIRPNDYSPLGELNKWTSILKNNEAYTIEKETINSVVPSNQLLRPWDNVPRKALAQDITGSRIVYGNYVQNYNITAQGRKKYVPSFIVGWDEFPDLIYDNYSETIINSRLTEAGKSIKSLREYQLGVVFTDKYGRETPVISNETGTMRLQKADASKYNRLNVKLNPSSFPNTPELKYFKFYIKETSGEYYNMAMDRWYVAEDNNVWLSFPSSDRNKIDIDTFLILKKGTDTNILVKEPARYKVIAIENEAPDYIKTKKSLAASITHSTTSDIFGDGTGNTNAFGSSSPWVGRDEFKMNYSPFFGSAGQHLDEYIGGVLYIEFENPITSEFSERYRITSITHDWNKNMEADPDTGNQYSVKLDKNIGDDILFITNSFGGTVPTEIKYGVKVNIYKYTIENSPKFDGRFFVKVYSDDVFSTNIGKSFLEGLEYRTIDSKKLYYMHPNHRAMHTSNVNDFLTNGDLSDNWIINALPPHGTTTGNEAFDRWGYYSIQEFTSMALFFRRYSKKERSTNGEMWLAHLKPGSENIFSPSGEYHDFDVTYNTDEYANNWTPASNWYKEYGYGHELGAIGDTEIGWRGYTNNFGIYYAAYEDFYEPGPFESSAPADVNRREWNKETNNGQLTADNARDTEVWFIDGGPFAGKQYFSTVDLNFGNIERYEKGFWSGDSGVKNRGGYDPYFDLTSTDVQLGGTVPNSIGPPHQGMISTYGLLSKGIQQGPGAHLMNIGFGGIKGADDHAGFWNIGDWNTSIGDGKNSNYTDLDNFVQNFESGIQFKWREDPTETIYTIGGDNKVQQVLRHSTIHDRFVATFTHANQASAKRYLDTGQIPAHASMAAMSMAELLSFNFTKNWELRNIVPDIAPSAWNPLQSGRITNGLTVNIPACNNSGVIDTTTPGIMATGDNITTDLQIFVQSLTGTDASGIASSATIRVGMALYKYTLNGGSEATVKANLGGASALQNYLVIRRIEKTAGIGGKGDFYTITLGGYTKPLRAAEHVLAAASGTYYAEPDSNYVFVQVGMNGYSHNSEFNINTMAHKVPTNPTWGAIGAVGYNIDFIEYIEPEEVLSENPAIWETEPKEEKDLDIYYEASAIFPINIDAETVSKAFPIGSYIDGFGTVVDYDGERVIVELERNITLNVEPSVHRPDGIDFNPSFNTSPSVDAILYSIEEEYSWIALSTVPPGAHPYSFASLLFEPLLYGLNYKLDWHNCYSFANGVESNRIRDNFNLPFITNGVKVSTTLEHDYEEEHRKYGLIYSGLYNSTSGVNNLNQFIQAEKITKDVNPIYGSIQKLHARNTDLVTLCEDKILKILSNKDAVFNADGNTNLTATENVLGQTIPFVGEYGISTNPESFASEAYRAYFTDRVRGRVLRLSMDGLTPISEFGMKDWFKDNLKLVNDSKIIGSYDDRNDEYVVKLEIIPPLNPSVKANFGEIVEQATSDDGTPGFEVDDNPGGLGTGSIGGLGGGLGGG